MTGFLVYAVLLAAVGFIFYKLHMQNKNLKTKLDKNKNAVVQLFTFCSDGIIVLDDEYRILSMNPAAERITGWKHRDIMPDMTCNRLFECSHEDGCSISDGMCPLKSGLQTLHNSEGAYGEFTIRHKDGTRRTVSASYFLIGDHDLHTPQYIMQLRDITQKLKESAQIDIIQEFVGSPHQVWDLQRIYNSVEAKCRRFFAADEVVLVMGNRLQGKDLAPEIAESLEPWMEEVSTKQEILERNLSDNRRCLLVPLLVEREVLGTLIVVFQPDQVFTLEFRKKLTLLAAQTAMVYKLHSLFEYSNMRRKEMEELYKLSILIRSTAVDKGFDYHVMEEIRKLSHGDMAAVLLYDKHHKLHWNSYSGPTQLIRDEFLEEQFVDALQFGNFSIMHKEGRPEHVLFQGTGIATLAVSPIVYRDSVYGVLLVGMKDKRDWNDHETYLMQNISSSIAVQIQNMQLHRKIENKATLLERGRISREIHDGLAQAIGYVNIQMHRITSMLEQGRIEQALQEIGVVKEVIAQSYGEIRDTITNLRLDQNNTDFLDCVKNHINEFHRMTGLQVNLQVDPKLPEVSEEVRIQVTRVIQEALANVKKHANASAVKLELRNKSGDLFVRISDNGQGFASIQKDRNYPGGHGLTIMRERIQAINGNLYIESKANMGTTITIDLGERRLQNVW